MEIYATVKGAKQGAFKADELIPKGHAGQMQLLSFDMGSTVPFDLATGQPSGKRMHHPIKFSKLPNLSGPNFMTALWTNEALTEVKFYFWRASNAVDARGTGEVNYVTVELKNAQLTKSALITGSFPSNNGIPTSRMEEHYEMTYQEVTYTWVKGGITANDTWLVNS